MTTSSLTRERFGKTKLALGQFDKIVRTRRTNYISNLKILSEPYPHTILDQTLSNKVIDEILHNWPIRGWKPEVPGNFTYEPFLSPRWIFKIRKTNISKLNFLERLFFETISDLTREMIFLFREYLPDNSLEEEIICDFAGFMNSDSNYKGHGIHQHSYHNPNWLVTILIYLEENISHLNGTAIHKIAGCPTVEETARISSDTLNWFNHPNIKLFKNYEFKRGQMLAFLDSPISFHSVEKSINDQSNRRILRIHAGFSNEWVKNRYSMSTRRFKAMALDQLRRPDFEEIVYNDLKDYSKRKFWR